MNTHPKPQATERYPYSAQIQAAKRWLGSQWLLARPINAPAKINKS